MARTTVNSQEKLELTIPGQIMLNGQFLLDRKEDRVNRRQSTKPANDDIPQCDPRLFFHQSGDGVGQSRKPGRVVQKTGARENGIMLEPSIDFKEQMAETRRTQILLGAAQIFAEKGFHKSTTKEIAKAAGVSEGTIYNYFDTKRELLIALMDSVITESLKRIIFDNPPQNPRELFIAIMRDRYQLAKERGLVIAPVVAEVFSDVQLRELLYQRVLSPIAGHLEQYVQTHIDSGHFRQIDPLVVTRAMMGALVMTYAIKLTNLDPRYENIPEEDLFEQLASLFLDGLLVSDQSSVNSKQ